MDTYSRVFDGLCRICLKHWSPESVLTPLVIDDELTNHATAVLTFANVQISPDDNLPQKICPKCLTLLKQSIIFKITCENTHKQLQEIKRKSTTEDLKTVLVKYCLHKHCFPHKQFAFPKKVVDEEVDDYFDVPLTNYESSGDESTVIKDILDTKMRVWKRRPNKVNGSKRPPRKRNRNKPTERPTCQICNKTYSCAASLQAHLKRHGDDTFICELCGRGFKAKKELEVHCVCTHGFPRRYSCAHCDYQAKLKRDLVIHLNKHTGTRPYKCWHCDKSFYSIQVYRQHQNHHKAKRFKCDSCPKEFYTIGDLNSHHNSVHYRRYVYRCGVDSCEVIYRNLSTVRRHMTTAHGLAREAQGRVERVFISSIQHQLSSARLRHQ